jgi:hypothetical protein
MNTRTKPEKLGALIKKVDEQVSLFVRLSAADDTGTISCVCCGERVYWKDADCAHFKDRDNIATRFYLPNLGAASRNCNRFDHYDHIERWRYILGPLVCFQLDLKAKSMEKFTRPELEEKLKEFTDKVKAIRKQKGL